MIGKKFNRLTIVNSQMRKGRRKYALCKCECGNKKWIYFYSITSGAVKSCGCFWKECISSLNKTHGLTNTHEYRVWQHIKRRCLDKRNKSYHNYGGRGISICDRWLNSFENFLSDMGNCPKGLWIERINNDGNYEPSNCKWTSPMDNSNNRRKNRIIKIHDISMTRSQWSRATKICTPSIIGFRILTGWNSLQAVFAPKSRMRKNHPNTIQTADANYLKWKKQEAGLT